MSFFLISGLWEPSLRIVDSKKLWESLQLKINWILFFQNFKTLNYFLSLNNVFENLNGFFRTVSKTKINDFYPNKKRLQFVVSVNIFLNQEKSYTFSSRGGGILFLIRTIGIKSIPFLMSRCKNPLPPMPCDLHNICLGSYLASHLGLLFCKCPHHGPLSYINYCNLL